jgi:hypothetical protein
MVNTRKYKREGNRIINKYLGKDESIKDIIFMWIYLLGACVIITGMAFSIGKGIFWDYIIPAILVIPFGFIALTFILSIIAVIPEKIKLINRNWK